MVSIVLLSVSFLALIFKFYASRRCLQYHRHFLARELMNKLALSLLVVSAFIGVVPACFAADFFLPEGCYVAYTDPDYCYEVGYGNTMHWTEGSDQALLAQRYGWAMALVMSASFETGQQLDLCLNDYNGLVDQFNVNVNDYNYLLGKYKKQVTLVKKLRKACGVPCKKIK